MLLFLPCFSWCACFSAIVDLPGKVTQPFGSKLSRTHEIWVSHWSDEKVCKYFGVNSSRFLFSRNYHIIVQGPPAVIIATYVVHEHTWRGRKKNREKHYKSHSLKGKGQCYISLLSMDLLQYKDNYSTYFCKFRCF